MRRGRSDHQSRKSRPRLQISWNGRLFDIAYRLQKFKNLKPKSKPMGPRAFAGAADTEAALPFELIRGHDGADRGCIADPRNRNE